MHLTRDSIVDAAIAILDNYGLADTTMRRVAASLDSAPGALYWHIANKQALIAAIAERIIEPMEGSTPAELALSLRACLLHHRDGAEVTSAGLSQPGNPTWLRVVEAFEQALAQELPGIDAQAQRLGAPALVHLVLGAATMEQARCQLEQVEPSTSQSSNQANAQSGATELAQGVAVIVAGLKALGHD